MRARWAAIGAVVAISLGAGGVGVTRAVVGSGSKPVFVAITPCRLVDTRPGPNNVGDRTSPLGPGGTLELQVTGSSGECSVIPADATAAAMNVTAIQGTDTSYLTVYPADVAMPTASNLNWSGGAAPTPNKVDVDLSSTGAVKMTNAFGSVHVAADLVGYYVDHHHDDRYYTRDEIDAMQNGLRTYVQPQILDFQPTDPGDGKWSASIAWTSDDAVLGKSCIAAPLALEPGEDVTDVEITYAAKSAVTADIGVAGTRFAPGTIDTEIVSTGHVNTDATLPATPAATFERLTIGHDDAEIPPTISGPREPAQEGYDYMVSFCTADAITIIAVRVNLA